MSWVPNYEYPDQVMLPKFPWEDKMSPEVYEWPASYPKKPDIWIEPPDPNKIRTPADILAEELAKVLVEQQELRDLVNEKLPRKPGTKVEIPLHRFRDDAELRNPIIAEVKKAGWLAKVEYNKLVIEFPKE